MSGTGIINIAEDVDVKQRLIIKSVWLNVQAAAI